jgi:ABC-type uncharacterized transport system substrate-binding protein
MSSRRDFITLLGGAAAAWPLTARAQRGERVPLVGIISNIIEDDPAMKARVGAFRQELEKFGWLPGRNVRIETRFGAVTPQQLQATAKELLALQPDVILANAPQVTRALQQASRTVPIVFVAVSDPIGAGLIASLARPGGNVTGLQNYEATITGKWLTMLKEIAPSTARAALVGNPHDADFDHFSGQPRARGSRLRSMSYPFEWRARLISSAPSRQLPVCQTAAWCCRLMAQPSSIAISSSRSQPASTCPRSTHSGFL